MAQPRTFQFYGLAYGNAPVTLTMSLNGNQVFSGPVHTVDAPLPGESNSQQTTAWPTPQEQVVLFSIENSTDLNTDFIGTIPSSLTVSGGSGVLLEQVSCNYAFASNPEGDANTYGIAYYGAPHNGENTTDPRSNVVIDGVAQSVKRPDGVTGTATWIIESGSTMTCNFSVGIGSVGTETGKGDNYVGAYSAFLSRF